MEQDNTRRLSDSITETISDQDADHGGVNTDTQDNESYTIRSALRDVGIILVAFLIAILVKNVALNNYVVPSASMEHTYDVGDTIIVNKLDHTPNRGDTVVFTAPNWRTPDTMKKPGIISGILSGDQGITYVKRAVGVPGDTIGGCGPTGHLIVNGKETTESYLKEDSAVGCNFPQVTLKDGEYWMMGDNRANSADSRYQSYDTEGENFTPSNGVIHKEDISGIVITGYTPILTAPVLNLIPAPWK